MSETAVEPTQTVSEGTQAETPAPSTDDAEALLAQLDTPVQETPAESTEQNPAETSTEGEVEPSLEDKTYQEAVEARAAELAEQRAKEAEAQAQREAAEQEKRDRETAYTEAVATAYRSSVDSVRRDLAQMGVHEVAINKAAEAMTQMKGQFDAAHALVVMDQLIDGLPESDAEAFREKYFPLIAERKVGYPSMIADLKERLLASPETHKGYISEAQADAKVKEGRLQLLKQLRENPALLTNPGAGPMRGGAGVNPASMTLAQIDAMPTEQWLAMGDRATRQNIIDAARAREGRR